MVKLSSLDFKTNIISHQKDEDSMKEEMWPKLILFIYVHKKATK